MSIYCIQYLILMAFSPQTIDHIQRTVAMLSVNEFDQLTAKIRNSKDLDNTQKQAVFLPAQTPLFLVAGPGSGKTTVLTLRLLKFIFVDGISPEEIVATTFTKKAAAELRSRILGWGEMLNEQLQKRDLLPKQKEFLRLLDINRMTTGTLDSLAETIMRDYRSVGDAPPVVLDQFLADMRLAQKGLFETGWYRDESLIEYIIQVRGPYQARRFATIKKFLRDISDRFSQNQVDIHAFSKGPKKGMSTVAESIMRYRQSLEGDEALDFARLEEEFLIRLSKGRLENFRQKIKVILVDEYQDTNYLQERIYFEIARATNGAITVVGDDDQSLYRFRGATVDLFREFPSRLEKELGVKVEMRYLNINYRSTKTIVHFFDNFAKIDPTYMKVRVKDKPDVKPCTDAVLGGPVLAMFRSNRNELARDLALMIHKIFRGKGFSFKYKEEIIRIERNHDGGAIGDCALLMSSPAEFSGNSKPRLPLLLKQTLGELPGPIEVFNPRGENYAKVKQVMVLCGLLIEAIDPKQGVQRSIINLPEEAVEQINQWRTAASQFIDSRPEPNWPHSLGAFIRSWGERRPQKRTSPWPKEVSILELCYDLVTWIPWFQNDPEGQIYLEVICRCIAQNAGYSRYESKILTAKNTESIKEAYWNIFVPLASGVIELNEELIETFPRDRLSILSIHQSKGLEFPMIIVDIGSDFEKDYRAQRFKRFPDGPGESHILEDEVRKYSPMKKMEFRDPLDRAFDDLFRQFFVAFSRAQSLLVVAGLNNISSLPNVAGGWSRDRIHKWRNGFPWFEI